MHIETASNARKKLFQLIHNIQEDHEPVYITSKNGNAVMLSQEDFEAIQETLYLLSIPGMRESILEAENTPIEEYSTTIEW